MSDRFTRPGWDSYFLGLAFAVSARADCRRRKVGAVIVGTDHRVLEVGYNGAPPGHPGCLEGACPRGLLTYDEVAAHADYSQPGTPGYCIALHAEINAIILAGRAARGATIYVTDEPCPNCRKAIMGAGIVRAVWPGHELDTSRPDGVPVVDASLIPPGGVNSVNNANGGGVRHPHQVEGEARTRFEQVARSRGHDRDGDR